MDQELTDSITVLAGRLADLAARDEKLRDALRRLLGAVLGDGAALAPIRRDDRNGRGPASEPAPDLKPAAVPIPESGPEPESEPESGPGPGPELKSESDREPGPEPETGPEPEARAPGPLPELTLGRSRPPSAEDRPSYGSMVFASRRGEDVDLDAVEARCRLKAEGVRWAAARRRLIDAEADFRLEVAPRDAELIGRARELDDCYLWMNAPDFSVPRDPAATEGAAGWFDAVADAAVLARRLADDFGANREFFEPALALLAEAQSALRGAVDRIGGQRDSDQFRAYNWLRGVADRERIFINRYMKLDDPADPALLPDFQRRLKALQERFQDVHGRSKRRKKALDRLRYHAKQIGKGNASLEHWRKTAGAADELLELGAPASSIDVREALLPILDALPDDEEFSRGFHLVLREIDRYMDGQAPTAEPPAEAAAAPPTPEVAEVARLLRGKSVLLIGGRRRPAADQALKTAFELENLYWFETKEHESIDVFAPYIARPDVALVVLAIRWSSHSFEGVKQFCEEHDKPMVRLPGGYGVNQVALQVLAQVSQRLAAD